jgi:hypothetical protein
VLVVVALVPAAALYALARWAGTQAGDVDAAPPVDPEVVVPAPAPALTTPVLGFRRMPTMVSRSVNGEAFRAESSRSWRRSTTDRARSSPSTARRSALATRRSR